MLKVCKFGGSSLAGAAEFLRVRDLVAADVARRVVVVSAPGRRHPDDQKITDLLYLCHAHLRYGVPCWELWRRVCDRFLAIRDGCGLHMPLEQELKSIYASLNSRTEEDFLASRGEYLAARLMAELLGFAFVDAAEWLRFDYDGQEGIYARRTGNDRLEQPCMADPVTQPDRGSLSEADARAVVYVPPDVG